MTGVLFACKGRVEPVSEYLNLHDSVAYVGKESCMQCHYDIYQSYMQTGMGQSIALSSKEKSASIFDENAVVKDLYSGFSYHPYWDGDTLFLKEFLEAHERIENIDYIIGSGHHTNSHLWQENGYLHQLPFTYYTQDGTLDLPPGFEQGNNSRFSRKIGLECMSCHNAYPDFIMGSENKYNHIPEGIDCERCHGAGGEHLKRMMAGELVDTSKYIDYSIVNPGKLPIDKQFQLCMRCHLQGNAVLADGKSFYDFKPGMELKDVMTVFTARYEDDESFIMASHADRLQQSACFQNAEMSCISCHDPHHSVRKTSSDHFNNKCASCHDVCAEKPSLNLDCVSCHMPESSSSDIPHVSITDHKIAVHLDSDKEMNSRGAFLGLFALNNNTPDHKTMAKAYLQQFEKFSSESYLLDSAANYLQKLPLEEVFQEWVHLYFLYQDYSSIRNVVLALDAIELNKMSYSNDHAWTSYRIGTAFLASSQHEEAKKYYEKAVTLAPYILDFRMKLASLYALQEDFQAAMEAYEWVLQEFPKMESAWCNLGYIHLKLGDSKQALSCYDKSLALNPNHIQTLLNMAALNLFNNNKEIAIQFLKRVLSIQSDNYKAQSLLNEING